MDIVLECLPEIRYFMSLSKAKSKKYIDEASPRLIECLFQTAINLIYADKDRNGIVLSPHHLKELKKHKKVLLRLVKTKKPSLQRKLLKRGRGGTTAIALLSVLAGVISTLASLL